MDQDPQLNDRFRQAMRQFASTVSIISTSDGAANYGMTATAVTSLCVVPPTLLVCVNKGASIHAPLSRAGRFCVSVLADQHVEVSHAFSGGLAPHQRFTVGDWRPTIEGLPYLADAQASMLCALKQTVGYGTHSVFIGEVIRVCSSAAAAPLLYHAGGYAGLTPLEAAAAHHV